MVERNTMLRQTPLVDWVGCSEHEWPPYPPKAVVVSDSEYQKLADKIKEIKEG